MRTQRRNGHTERQPNGNEELYQLIAEHSTDMISKHTPEGIYTYASPACRSLLGYEPEELIGRSAYDFFHHEDLDAIRKITEGQKADLKQETDALRRAAKGLRSVVHDLRQEKEQPFVRAIEALVEYNRQLTPERQIRLSVQEDFPQELPEQVKVELLRTVQQALTNVRQHSEAQWVGVKLHKQQDQLCTEVVDDGRGFDPESVRRGLGLLGMRERIEIFGGKLEIRSEVGKGTMVWVTVPIQALASDN